MQIIESAAQAKATTFRGLVAFRCSACHTVKPVKHSGGTGYGYDRDDNLVCYACCSERDKRDMRANGRATLYLSQDKVTNWPGTLAFPVAERRTGYHNIAGKRYDVWFRGPDRALWHGVQYGDNTQICHCRRIKER